MEEEDDDDGESDSGGGGGGGTKAQGPAEQKGWDLEALFAKLQALCLDDSRGYVTRAVLVLGRSYALPQAPDPAARGALRPLLDSDRFFLDVLYVHAVEGGSAPPGCPGRRRRIGRAASLSMAARRKTAEVEVVDVEDTGSEAEDEDEGGAAGIALAAPAAAAVVPVRAQAIWEALTEYGERHPWKPQGDYFFDVAHGPRGVHSLLLRAQMLLAHAGQRETQVRVGVGVGVCGCLCVCGWVGGWRVDEHN